MIQGIQGFESPRFSPTPPWLDVWGRCLGWEGHRIFGKSLEVIVLIVNSINMWIYISGEIYNWLSEEIFVNFLRENSWVSECFPGNWRWTSTRLMWKPGWKSRGCSMAIFGTYSKMIEDRQASGSQQKPTDSSPAKSDFCIRLHKCRRFWWRSPTIERSTWAGERPIFLPRRCCVRTWPLWPKFRC